MNETTHHIRGHKTPEVCRLKRAAAGERVDLGERDHTLFLGLFEAGIMLRSQIAELYFDGSYEAAGKRVQKLLKHGYLRERRVPDRRGQYLPSWLTLTPTAFLELKAKGRVTDTASWEALRQRLARSPMTLAHDLAVVDLWVAFAKAVRTRDAFGLRRFATWPSEFRFAGGHVPTVLEPDAFSLLSYVDDPTLPPIESAIFFEWDRSTETRRVLLAKASLYDRFYRSGAFAERMGGSRDRAEEYPFRTVFAVRNEERRNNLLEEFGRQTSSRQLIHDQFWCTTWNEILTDPFGAIYLHIGDYVAATAGTVYAPARFITSQRARDRDELVRQRAELRKLLD